MKAIELLDLLNRFSKEELRMIDLAISDTGGMAKRLMTEDAAYVTAFIDHMPVPKKQREQLRARVIDELKARGAMAR